MGDNNERDTGVVAMAKVKKKLYKVTVYPARDPMTGKPIESETEIMIFGTNAEFIDTELEIIFQIRDGRSVVFGIPSERLIYCAAIDNMKKTEPTQLILSSPLQAL